MANDLTAVGRRALCNASGDDGTALGSLALENATSGASNTAVGYSAGRSITTGVANVFVGANAGSGGGQSVTATNSIAIGSNAVTTKNDQAVLGGPAIAETVLRGELIINEERLFLTMPLLDNYFAAAAGPSELPTGNGNVGFGLRAVSSVTDGIMNTGIGYQALMSVTTGDDNTAIGAGALESMTTGIGNSAIGRLALARCSTGTNNTGLADTALEFLTTGNHCTAVGYSAGIKAVTGDDNCLFGVFAGGHSLGRNGPDCSWARCNVFGTAAMQLNETGDKNNLFGTRAGHVLTSAENCGFGDEALRVLTTGEKNSVFGHESGWRLTTGSLNVFIGHQAGANASQKVDASGTTVVGAGAFSTRDDEVVIGKVTDTHVTIAGVEFTKAEILELQDEARTPRWEVVDTWNYGGTPVDKVDFVDLDEYSELIVRVRNMTLSSADQRLVRCSVDNGTTFFSANGDYTAIDADGVEDPVGFSGFALHSTASAAARSGTLSMIGINCPERMIQRVTRYNTHELLFTGSAAPINAIRVLGGAANITGGSITLLGRR